VEYRARRENQALRDRNIRVLPIARQTKHVDGTQANGSADAQLNVEDLIKTFGASYLQSQGGSFLMFLDVEGTPSLSTDYYLGWARTLVDHSQSISHGTVTILPGVYATQADDMTWRAVAEASQRGVQTQGAWVARWRIRGCGTPLDWDPQGVVDGVAQPHLYGLDRRVERLANLSVPEIEAERPDFIGAQQPLDRLQSG
jgi:hypothetical protein